MTHIGPSSGKSFGKNFTLMGKSLDQLANGQSVMVPAEWLDQGLIQQWAKSHGFVFHSQLMEMKKEYHKVWFTQDEGHIFTKMFEVDVAVDSKIAPGCYVVNGKTYQLPEPKFVEDPKPVYNYLDQSYSMKAETEVFQSSIQQILEAFGVPQSVIGFSTSNPNPSPTNAPDWASSHTGLNQAVDAPEFCKCGDGRQWNLQGLIQHLNDKHKKTYAEIADWLDTLENQPVFYPKLESEEPESEKKYNTCQEAGCNNPTFDDFCATHDFAHHIESGPVEFFEKEPIAGHKLTFSTLDDSEGINYVYDHKCGICGFLNHGHEDCPFV